MQFLTLDLSKPCQRGHPEHVEGQTLPRLNLVTIQKSIRLLKKYLFNSNFILHL